MAHETAVSSRPRYVFWWLLAAILLLWLIGGAVYIAGGGKIWLRPDGIRAEGIGSTFIPCLIVATEEDAKKFVDANKHPGPSKDDIIVGMNKLMAAPDENGRYVLWGMVGWSLSPYRGYPGEVLWVKTTSGEIIEHFDDVFHRHYPGVSYEWHPEMKKTLDNVLSDYKPHESSAAPDQTGH